jgi:uncharacterized membrane protein
MAINNSCKLVFFIFVFKYSAMLIISVVYVDTICKKPFRFSFLFRISCLCQFLGWYILYTVSFAFIIIIIIIIIIIPFNVLLEVTNEERDRDWCSLMYAYIPQMLPTLTELSTWSRVPENMILQLVKTLPALFGTREIQ